MNMIYNSPNYCVVEFRGPEFDATGGFEIMDKALRREIFIAGSLATRFRDDVETLIATAPSIEEVDNYLSQFNELMHQPMTLH